MFEDLVNAIAEEGVRNNINVDIFFNLDKIEDVKMSSNAVKRKRTDREDSSSQA